VTAAMFAWVSLGDSSNPPERIKVEVCKDCSAIVPVVTFDAHGHFHRDLERVIAIGER
jgi:hypothetical protein